MVTLAGETVDEVRVGDVERCERPGHGYFWLVPQSGRRTLGLGRGRSGDVAGCMRAPEGADDCPEVNAQALLESVYEELASEGVDVVGYGVHVCPDASREAAPALSVRDWGQVDEAVRALAAEMRDWDIGDRVAVSVRTKPCVVDLEEAER